jgi:hypothetical protein
MSAITQEEIALLIVAVAASVVAVKFFRDYIAEALAKQFLKRGKVKWAMKFKSQAKAPGCNDCH